MGVKKVLKAAVGKPLRSVASATPVGRAVTLGVRAGQSLKRSAKPSAPRGAAPRRRRRSRSISLGPVLSERKIKRLDKWLHKQRRVAMKVINRTGGVRFARPPRRRWHYHGKRKGK